MTTRRRREKKRKKKRKKSKKDKLTGDATARWAIYLSNISRVIGMACKLLVDLEKCCSLIETPGEPVLQ